MCKSIKNQFDEKLNFDTLEKAYKNAVKNKKKTNEILYFEMNLENNLYTIYKDLKNGTYKTGVYREFTIYEPKKRIIRSLPFRDRIVQQWITEEFLKPYFIPRFIPTTFACIPDRGTHKAFEKLEEYSNKMYHKYKNFYYVKFDIKKFFYSIDKNILIEMLSRYISDKKLLAVCKEVIDDGKEKGIAIGNYTSQYFANIYLSKMDYYIKHDLKVKYYLRYMDDFICMVETKEEARNVLKKVNTFVNEKLNLELNHKSRIIPSYLGIDFCGYVYKNGIRVVRKSFLLKIVKRCKKWNTLYKKDKLNKKKMYMCMKSYLAHACHSSTKINFEKWLKFDFETQTVEKKS